MRPDLESLANRLLVASGAISSRPTNLNTIAEYLNAKVCNLWDPVFSLGEAFTYKPYRTPFVVLNKSVGTSRRRFNYAHELSHIALHHEGCLHEYTRNQKIYDWQEREANYVAGAVLMPRGAFFEVFNEFEDFRITAREFGVSQKAARVRYDVLTGMLYLWD